MNRRFIRQHWLRLALLLILLLLALWVYDGWRQLMQQWQAWPAVLFAPAPHLCQVASSQEGK